MATGIDRTGRALLTLVVLDGIAGLSFLVAAAVTSSASLAALAAISIATWLLALVSVPQAARAPNVPRVAIATVLTSMGVAIHTVGCLGVLFSYPGATPSAVAGVTLGAAAGAGYLLLLRRRLHDVRGIRMTTEPRPR